ncbi:MAG: hypothetical protein Nk1A_6450 [Endomicrobiia bacterium]|nr:MAG: hypothetical protein Nk1A_6450 [Endomicrobiia bacterium]
MRSLNNEIRNFIRVNILRKFKIVELTHEVKCVANYGEIGESFINTSEITEKCIKTAQEFYGESNVEILEKLSMCG